MQGTDRRSGPIKVEDHVGFKLERLSISEVESKPTQVFSNLKEKPCVEVRGSCAYCQKNLENVTQSLTPGVDATIPDIPCQLLKAHRNDLTENSQALNFGGNLAIPKQYLSLIIYNKRYLFLPQMINRIRCLSPSSLTFKPRIE